MNAKNYYFIIIFLLGGFGFGQNAPTTSWLTQIYTGNDKTLADLSISGTNIKWYTAPYGGTLLPNNTLLVDNSIYYASQTIAGQESFTRLPVTVKRVSDNSQVLPPGSTLANLVATPSVGATAKWYATPTGGTPLSSTTSLVNGTTYYVEQSIPSSITSIGAPLNFSLPSGVVVQPDGKILVLDTGNGSIKKMNQDGTNIVTLRSGFVFPTVGLALQTDGKILFSDSNNGILYKMDADGNNLINLASGFFSQRGIAIQPDGKILVADTQNSVIKRVNADGSNAVILGSGFFNPRGVAIQQDGKIVVADYNNNAIKRMDPDGSNIITLGSGFNQPTGVAIQMDGKILIADTSNGVIKRMNPDGTNIVTIAAGFVNPRGLTIFPNGDILASDPGNNAVKRIVESSTSNRVPVLYTYPPPGTHLNFDGTNDYVDIGNVLPANSSYTKEAWIYATNVTNPRNIISSPSHVFWMYNGTIFAGSGSSQTIISDPVPVPVNSWTHVALTYNSSNGEMKLYRDGVLSVGTGINVDPYAGDVNFIGSYQGNGMFEGNMEEVRIWNVALSESDIRARRFCELSGNETGLVAYYKFNQGIDGANNSGVTSLSDSSGNNHSGTLVNFSLNGAVSNWKAGSPITTGIAIPSTPSVSTTQTFCTIGTTAASLVPPPSATIRWYRSSTSNTPVASTDLLTYGVYYVVNVNANGCESARVSVQVNPNTVLTSTSPIVYEKDEVADPLTANGSYLLWYTSAVGGTGSSTAPVPSTSTVGTTSYWVSQAIPGCAESNRIKIDVTVVLTNDSCDGALTLTVGSNFNSNAEHVDLFGASDSPNQPFPNCGSYSGADRWYKFTVPATGNFKVETGPYSIGDNYDTGLALYSGSCSNLTLSFCNDDNPSASGPTGYSFMSGTGYTPGTLLYLRVWEFNNAPSGLDFLISVYDQTVLSQNNFEFKGLKLYPNPFADTFKIETEEDAIVTICDVLGNEIQEQQLVHGVNSIELKGKSSGLYFVKIQNEKGSKTFKIVKD